MLQVLDHLHGDEEQQKKKIWRFSHAPVGVATSELQRARKALRLHSETLLKDHSSAFVVAEAGAARHAGILVPLYERSDGEVLVLLTERSKNLNSHGMMHV